MLPNFIKASDKKTFEILENFTFNTTHDINVFLGKLKWRRLELDTSWSILEYETEIDMDNSTSRI